MSLEILGTGSALPAGRVANSQLVDFLDTDNQWIVSRTGIQQRHICQEESLTDLAAAAAMQALDNGGIEAGALDLLVCATLQGDRITPSLACQVQGRIAARCPAFDINAACSGFIYGLDLAAAYLESGRARNILLVCADAMSRLVDWQDRANCILFGDGAGAVVLTQGSSLKALKLTASCDEKMLQASPQGGNCPFTAQPQKASPLTMNGQEVYRFAVISALRDLELVTAQAGLNFDQIDYFLIHQANLRILEALRQRLNQPASKFPANVQRYGNTSAASIPILLDELNRAGSLQPGQFLVCSAFGAGLTTGACVLQWNPVGIKVNHSK